MRFFRSVIFQITAVLALTAAWKILFIFWDVIPFNSDEAIVALMARHITTGARPIFFYGQAYMGSLDAFLVAAGFSLLGQHVWVIRLVQTLLYLGTVLTTIFIGKEIFGSFRIGMIAGLLLAIPTVNVSLYTTASLGGYGEALLIGNLLLLLALRMNRQLKMPDTQRVPWLGFGAWGLLAGCGLWANGLTLVYSVPAGLYLLWGLWRCRRGWLPVFLLVGGLGVLLGSLPWWIFALENGLSQLVLELFGTAVAVERSPWLVRTGMHLVNFLLLGVSVIFGFRPPWNVSWLALPVLPFVLMFWMFAVTHFTRRWKADRRAEYGLLAGVIAVLLAGFLFTAFGVDPSGRYFLPLAVPLALVGAQAIAGISRRAWQTAALLALVVGYQFIGTLQSAANFPPGLTTQFHEPTIIDHRADAELIAFLRQQGETRGYSNYWVAYPLAFHSAEDLIFVPRLPYHLDLRYTPRDDRYPAYTAAVAESPRVAYITTRNPRLDAALRERFTSLAITWEEQLIGDYHVYYRLSRAVRPQEIGFGAIAE